MTKIRMAGAAWATPPGNARTPSYYGANKYAFLYSGLVTEIRNYYLASGNNKPSAYYDNGSDHPGDLLGSVDTDVAGTSGNWVASAITAAAATQGNHAWIGGNCDTSGALCSAALGSDLLRYVAATYATWTASDPCVTLPSTFGETLGMQLWGYAKPTTSSIDGDNAITIGQTNIDIAGLHFDDDTSGPTVWFTDSASWGSETIKVQQTRNSFNDTTINIDYADPGTDLSAGTGWYVWIETGLGQVQATGLNFEIQSASASDTPSGLSIEFNVLSLSASGAVSDTPGGISIEFSALSLPAVSSVSDIPSGINVEFALLSLPSTSAVSDIPGGLQFEFSMLLLDAYAETGATDTPAGLSYDFGLLNVDAYSSISDLPSGFTMEFSALLLTAEASSSRTDTPNGLTFEFSGLALVAVSNLSDTPSGIDFEYSFPALMAYEGKTDTPNGIGMSFSLSDLDAYSAQSDIPDGLSLSFSFLTLTATSADADEVTTTVYARQREMALNLIARKGQSVTWRRKSDPVTADADKPFDVTEATPVDVPVSIVFLPVDRTTQTFIQRMTGTLVPIGFLVGLMGYHDFTPSIKDVVIRGTRQLRIKNIDELSPNGEQLLYTILFEQ